MSPDLMNILDTRVFGVLAVFFFFFNDPAPAEIYTLSLHDALPISEPRAPTRHRADARPRPHVPGRAPHGWLADGDVRSEEHTSELQSRFDLVCRLLLEKKKNVPQRIATSKAFQPQLYRRSARCPNL